MTAPDEPSPSAGNAPDRELAGSRAVDGSVVEWTPELIERREAVADLGDALRDLAERSIGAEVPSDVLREVADQARDLAATLAERQRGPGELSSVDDYQRGQRPFNPVVGAGNPVAPPMRVEIVDGVAIGTCTLGRRHEGPFGFAHGGVSALLLDQIMGYAAAANGHPGMTGRLQLRYFTAVPLGVPLRMEARLVDVLGVRAAIHGSISLADEPDTALVEAEGSFLALRPEQAERLFGDGPRRAD